MISPLLVRLLSLVLFLGFSTAAQLAVLSSRLPTAYQRGGRGMELGDGGQVRENSGPSARARDRSSGILKTQNLFRHIIDSTGRGVRLLYLAELFAL